MAMGWSTAARWPARLGVAGAMAAVLLGALPFAGAPLRAAESLDAEIEIDQPYLVKGRQVPVYVFLRFEAPELERRDTARPPLNLNLVLDRSGSMAEDGKMEYLKPAALMAIDRLDGRDILSVVEYDDEITLMWPAQRVGDLRRLERRIEKLEPRGSTNLAGGLERGIAEAEEVAGEYRGDDGRLTRIVLLSDGLANVGMTDPREIGRMVREARRKGLRVSAIGLGRDYDEDLLERIAEMGGGNYHYVEHPSQLARIFEEELMTAFTTAAKDVRLTFTGTDGVRAAEIIGIETAGSGADLTLDWDDFYAGEERSLVLRLEVDAAALGALDLGTVALSYEDVATRQSLTLTRAVRVTVTEDVGLAEREINPRVKAEAALVESDRRHAEAIKLYQSGEAEEANRRIDALRDELEAQNAILQDERLANKIEGLGVEQQQMAAASTPAAQADFIKTAKTRLFEARDGKRALSLLVEGDKGIAVERLQQALKDSGHYDGPVDGLFDAEVRAAVEAYQRQQNIEVDGVAGPVTMDRMGLY